MFKRIDEFSVKVFGRLAIGQFLYVQVRIRKNGESSRSSPKECD